MYCKAIQGEYSACKKFFSLGIFKSAFEIAESSQVSDTCKYRIPGGFRRESQKIVATLVNFTHFHPAIIIGLHTQSVTTCYFPEIMSDVKH